MSLDLFLKTFSDNSIKLISPLTDFEAYTPIDLSVSNPNLSFIDFSCSNTFSKYIKEFLNKSNKSIAYGGYLEQRHIYKRSSHFNSFSNENPRDIHLGIDFWDCNLSPVLAAFDGVVHSFKNNTALGDYGPTIILEHNFSGINFFTLYGHLSLDSINHLKIGTVFNSGDQIGFLGDSNVNGDYPPHLHFQIIKDIQKNFGDYPGVCSMSEIDFYKNNCPDPNLILKLK